MTALLVELVNDGALQFNETISRRVVIIELTPEQAAKVKPLKTGSYYNSEKTLVETFEIQRPICIQEM